MAEVKKVTRIKATDTAPKKSAKGTPPAAPVKPTGKGNVFSGIADYFKGAWVELRQVRWPNRRSTWALTVAVILFSLFFLGFIVLLDMLFKYIFELIIV